MKSVSAALQAHFGLPCTTLATIWLVVLQNGTTMGFTTLDRNVTFNSQLYLAASGFLPNANETNSDLSVDNLEVTGFLDNAIIKEADIRNGLYDYASVTQSIINWADLTQGAMILRRGIIGNISMKNGMFQAEVRGLTQYLSTNIGAIYGPLCRAELFSDQSNTIDPNTRYYCHVKEADYIQSGSVSSAPNAVTLIPNGGLVEQGSATPSAAAASGWFNDGVVTFTSGVNNGYSFEIKTWDGTTLTLFLPMPYQPSPGDTFTIEPGCDKSPTSTGCQKFQGYSSDGLQTIVSTTNIANFRGEPFIPGTDLILQYPDAT